MYIFIKSFFAKFFLQIWPEEAQKWKIYFSHHTIFFSLLFTPLLFTQSYFNYFSHHYFSHITFHTKFFKLLFTPFMRMRKKNIAFTLQVLRNVVIYVLYDRLKHYWVLFYQNRGWTRLSRSGQMLEKIRRLQKDERMSVLMKVEVQSS